MKNHPNEAFFGGAAEARLTDCQVRSPALLNPPAREPAARELSGAFADTLRPDVRDITIRRAGRADIDPIMTLFTAVYGDSSHPFHSTSAVSAFLADARNFQIVAEKEKCVVGSAAMACNPWNASYELGRMLTVPEHRKRGLAGVLLQQVLDWLPEPAACEVIFGYPRLRAMADRCATLDPRMIVVGHDAGRNIANGSREIHLIIYGIPRYARFTHATPRIAGLSNWRFLMERLYTPLGLVESPAEYPPDCFIGGVPRDCVCVGAWTFDYAAGKAGGSLEVISRFANGDNPQRISQELDGILRGIPQLEHVTATVLADKQKLIATLVRRGFEMSAYLPAWYKRGAVRYDCVQLTKRLYRCEASTRDYPDVLDGLQTEFRSNPVSGHSMESHEFSGCGAETI